MKIEYFSFRSLFFVQASPKSPLPTGTPPRRPTEGEAAMTLAAKKLFPLNELGAKAAARRAPDLTVISGSLGEKVPHVRDTLNAHLGNAAIATYGFVFLANAIATHVI
jgi:hypothetical protein